MKYSSGLNNKPYEMKDVTGKPHKFFESMLLPNDKIVQDFAQEWYEYLKKKRPEMGKALNYREDADGSAMMEFILAENVLGHYHPVANQILSAVRELTIEACKYYEIDYKAEQYYIHAWLNYAKGPRTVFDDQIKLDDHGWNPKHFHGYYAINAEPSITFYELDEPYTEHPTGLYPLENKNGRVLLSMNGYQHGVGSWLKEEPRITLAYNIMPLAHVPTNRDRYAQYLPLL